MWSAEDGCHDQGHSIMKYRPKHVLEYAALRLMAAAVGAPSHRGSLLIANGLAHLTHPLARRAVRTAHRRIREVFGDELSDSRVRQIAWISWRNLCFNAAEMLRLARTDYSWMDDLYVSTEAFEYVRRINDTGTGVVAAIPHMGSWELTGLRAHRAGVPILNIAARQRNPLVNEFMNRLRKGPGITTIARGAGTMREVITRLRAGATLAILPDVRMRTGGIPVPFLGKTANLGEGAALFARHVGAPLIPSICRRVGWNRHEVTHFPPILGNPAAPKADDILRMMTELMAVIEQEIRKTPEQWFWYNRRWVLEPVEPGPPPPSPA